MGYRSDVGLVLTHNAVSILKKKISELPDYDNWTEENKFPPETLNEIRQLLKYPVEHCIDSKSHSELYHWSYIKWYDDYDYPDIYFITDFLNNLDDSDYLFMRVGEDYSDIEISGEFWDNPFDMGIIREVRFTA